MKIFLIVRNILIFNFYSFLIYTSESLENNISYAKLCFIYNDNIYTLGDEYKEHISKNNLKCYCFKTTDFSFALSDSKEEKMVNVVTSTSKFSDFIQMYKSSTGTLELPKYYKFLYCDNKSLFKDVLHEDCLLCLSIIKMIKAYIYIPTIFYNDLLKNHDIFKDNVFKENNNIKRILKNINTNIIEQINGKDVYVSCFSIKLTDKKEFFREIDNILSLEFLKKQYRFSVMLKINGKFEDIFSSPLEELVSGCYYDDFYVYINFDLDNKDKCLIY